VLAHLAFWGWVYRLRPDSDGLLWAECADGWKLAVAHYKPAFPDSRPPVVLCHGLGANRWNLCLPGTHSLAAFLKERGHEVFVPDLRGCGDSQTPPPGKDRNDWNFDDHVLLDAPAILALAQRCTTKPQALWVGHSMGGMIGLALAEGPHATALAGVAALGSPTHWSFHRRILGRLIGYSVHLAWGGRVHNRFMVRLIAPYLGYAPFPLNDVALNPRNIDGATYRRVAYHVLADSSRKVLAQFASWFSRDAWDLANPKTDLRAGLANVRCPVLLIGGTLDLLAPPQAMERALGELGTSEKTLLLFGKSRGDAQDYGHGDLIFGRRAPDEIFPELERWLGARG
jgi:pimeloyl-ACP methyl ester carboxylesterase